MGAPPGEDAQTPGSFRARQLQAVLRLTPLAMLANLMNAALICYVFQASVPPVALAVWAALVVTVSSYGMRAWRR